ncbi:MAG: sulfurtransferase [Cyanobacteria bacterium P01_G01_bin.39]
MNYAHPETLVSTQWLAEHLDDPQLRIIEIDLNSQAYDQGHIPGSIFWSVITQLSSNMSMNLDPASMSRLLSNSGIANETTVVIVHGDHAAASGASFWQLKLFGHRDVRILNGGRQKWQEEGFPLTTGETKVKPTNYQIKDLDNSLRISTIEVKKSMEQNAPILLDVRTPQEYRGEIYLEAAPQADEKGGHIPGAINIDYELAHHEDGTFKSADQLQEIYGDLITTNQEIVPYCAVGGRSGHTWYVLKYLLGCDRVRNYDGSWNEWSRLANAPIATDG